MHVLIQLLLRGDWVPGTGLGTSYVLTHLILITVQAVGTISFLWMGTQAQNEVKHICLRVVEGICLAGLSRELDLKVFYLHHCHCLCSEEQL